VVALAQKLVRDIAEGQVIYLHCWGGHGRTGTVVCIMLHLLYGVSAWLDVTKVDDVGAAWRACRSSGRQDIHVCVQLCEALLVEVLCSASALVAGRSVVSGENCVYRQLMMPIHVMLSHLTVS
jgi:hypothetical protein